MNDFLSAYGRPSDRLNAIKGLLGNYSGESSVLSQMGDYLNSSLGLANIKSIAPVQGSQGTTYMVTSNDGQQYAMTAPGTRQGDGAYVARPVNLDAGKFVFGESFGGGADNQGAASDAPARFAGGWQGQLDGSVYLSPYTEGMAMPEVVFDKNAYSEDSLLQGIAPYLAVAAPAIIGAFAPGLMESLGAGAAEVGAAGAAGASTPVGAMSVPGVYGGMSSTAALANAGSTGAMLGGFGANAMGTGLTLAGADALGSGLSALGSSGIPGIDYEVPQSDLDALMDSPAGGGGTTTDWWKQAISPSSNYSITDLIRTAIPADLLPTGTGTDKLLEKSLGLLTQGQQPTGGLLGGGGGGYSRGNSPYSANPVAYQKAQYSKLFGE